MVNNIKTGDKVVCTDKGYFGVCGTVIKQYYPTGSEQQSMIECYNGKLFHAPTRCFCKVRYDNGKL
ncbi:MAG: hypothetical protein ACI4HN_08280 [Ruminococcus sp.]